MNKLDALIASLTAAESGRIDALEWVPHADIRKVLEAVREDMAAQAERNSSCACPESFTEIQRCLDCHRIVFRTIREALEG